MQKKNMYLLWTNQITKKLGKHYSDEFSSVIFKGELETPFSACQLQTSMLERKWTNFKYYH